MCVQSPYCAIPTVLRVSCFITQQSGVVEIRHHIYFWHGRAHKARGVEDTIVQLNRAFSRSIDDELDLKLSQWTAHPASLVTTYQSHLIRPIILPKVLLYCDYFPLYISPPVGQSTAQITHSGSFSKPFEPSFLVCKGAYLLSIDAMKVSLS